MIPRWATGWRWIVIVLVFSVPLSLSLAAFPVNADDEWRLVNPHRVTPPDIDSAGFLWSPDGQYLSVTAGGTKPYTDTMRVYIVRKDGSGLRMIGENYWSGAWVPGTKILSYMNTGRQVELHDVATGGREVLPVRAFHPRLSWSLTGLLCVQGYDTNYTILRVYDRSGVLKHQLDGMQRAHMLPDGKHLLLEHDLVAPKGAELCVFSLEDRSHNILLRSGPLKRFQVEGLSSDGQFALTRQYEDAGDAEAPSPDLVWVSLVDGQRRVIKDMRWMGSFSIDPRGNFFLYSAPVHFGVNIGWKIFVGAPDGRRWRLTWLGEAQDGDSTSPQWSPDGTHIAFQYCTPRAGGKRSTRTVWMAQLERLAN